MKLFSVDVKIMATAYILADSEEEAQKTAARLKDQALEFSSRRQGVGVDDEIVISGETYSADMPEITLSPAMTLYGPEGREVDLVEEFEADEECEECFGFAGEPGTVCTGCGKE